jgi:hypothetical protein
MISMKPGRKVVHFTWFGEAGTNKMCVYYTTLNLMHESNYDIKKVWLYEIFIKKKKDK